MGVSLDWLKQYVDIDYSAEELAHRLTMAGIAIEGVEAENGDQILELDLTPNRGDCLGMINLAREVAALNGSKVRIPDNTVAENHEAIADYIAVEISAPELCQRYAARLVKNVTIKESPAWMQEALLHSGVRPINNIVDITNYVMLETNQPLHAFDYHLLGGTNKKIVVRRAINGEEFITLDQMERELDGEMLVITDGSRPVAIAGIMGGLNSEIKDNTRDVLIESAWFMGPNVRRTSRRLALRTDSSQRFEKGTDINGLIYALNRAAALMQQLGGGEVIGGICDAYPHPTELKQITLRPTRVNHVLGTELLAGEIRTYLERLAFPIEELVDGFRVVVPSYRPDITMEVDLIEEVARLHGYDNIPAALPVGDTTQGGLTPVQKFRDLVKNIMAQSLYEVVNYSFINPAAFDLLQLPSNSTLRNAVVVANPLSEEQGVMRTLLLPGLIAAVSTNVARKNENLAFFEMGAVFHPSTGRLPAEQGELGAIVAGHSEVNWLQQKVDMDFFFLKGVLEDLLGKLGIDHCHFQPIQAGSYHPGRTANIICGGTLLGVIGEIHPLVLQNYDIKARCCAFELDMEALYVCSRSKLMTQAITRYPAVERDIAVLLADDVLASDAVATIREAEGELLREVVVFDIYTGEQVPSGYKSVAFRLLFQSSERTLTEAEIADSMGGILQSLEDRLKATRR